MSYKSKLKIFIISILVMLPLFCFAQDWPQWRGPARDGFIPNFQAPKAWPENPKLLWKTNLGSGIASPIISGQKAWIHTRKDENEIVTCIDLKSGKTLWTKSYSAPFTPNPPAAKMGNGPFATPILHKGKIYTLGISAILSCFDAITGELKWQKNFGPVSTSALFCGTSASPLVDQKNLIVQIGDDLRGAIYALDLDTGNEKWKWTGDSVAYASPIIAEFEGTRQIVAHTNNATVGVDVQTGKLLWQESFTETKWRENIVTPLKHQKFLILSNGAQGAVAFQISKAGDEWKAKKVWQNTDIAMYMSTPVLSGDYLFGMSAKRKGMLFCLNATDGKVLWSTKGEEGDNAAVLHAADLVFFLNEQGNLKVIKKTHENYQQVATYDVSDSPTWAHPVIWQNHILIKDDSNLSLWSF